MNDTEYIDLEQGYLKTKDHKLYRLQFVRHSKDFNQYAMKCKTCHRYQPELEYIYNRSKHLDCKRCNEASKAKPKSKMDRLQVSDPKLLEEPELPTGPTGSLESPTGPTGSLELPTGPTGSLELPTGSTGFFESPTGSTGSFESPTDLKPQKRVIVRSKPKKSDSKVVKLRASKTKKNEK